MSLLSTDADKSTGVNNEIIKILTFMCFTTGIQRRDKGETLKYAANHHHTTVRNHTKPAFKKIILANK
jgi:hypothetical protein